MADSVEYLGSLNARRFLCCCRRIHVKKGALIAGTLELFVATAVMLTFIIIFIYAWPAGGNGADGEQETTASTLEQGNDGRTDASLPNGATGAMLLVTTEESTPLTTRRVSTFVFAVGISLGLLYVAAIGLMFLGVRRRKARFVVPHLVVQLLTVLFLATAVVLSIMVLATGYFAGRRDEPSILRTEKTEVAAVAVLITCSIMLGFEVWFMNIVYNCYRYLRARQAHLQLFFTKKTAVAPAAPTTSKLPRAYTPADLLLPWIDASDE